MDSHAYKPASDVESELNVRFCTVLSGSETTLLKMVLPLLMTGTPLGPIQLVVADWVRPLSDFRAMQVRVCLLPALAVPVLEGVTRTMMGEGGTIILL